jgi:hypothetical protein
MPRSENGILINQALEGAMGNSIRSVLAALVLGVALLAMGCSDPTVETIGENTAAIASLAETPAIGVASDPNACSPSVCDGLALRTPCGPAGILFADDCIMIGGCERCSNGR